MSELKEIFWQSPEFRHQSKDVSWYWLTIIAAAIIFLIAIWQKNFLFAVFVIIAEMMVIFWAGRPPKTIRFKADREGITAGETTFYPYDKLAGFHIHEGGDGVNELILKTRNMLHLHIRILLAEEATKDVRNFLGQRLEEIEYEESLADSISNIIGF